MNNVFTAILMAAIAGLSTGIGGLVVFCSKKLNKKFLAFTLGVSAGVMLYVSFVELFAKAGEGLAEIYGIKQGATINAVAFFCGICFVALIDRIIPEGVSMADVGSGKLMRTGVVTALTMAVHNFPEGMATFMSAFQSPTLALPIVAAIAIHNIPEGVAVAVPIAYATQRRGKGFVWSLLSGCTEPLGAILGYLVLMPFLSETVKCIVFSAVAGIMIFISIDELLPSARECGAEGISVLGTVVGMAIMALSLIGFM